MPVPARSSPERDSSASGKPGRRSPTCRFKTSRLRTPSTTSGLRNDRRSRPRGRHAGRSRPGSRQRSRAAAYSRSQGHRALAVPRPPRVRPARAGEHPELLTFNLRSFVAARRKPMDAASGTLVDHGRTTVLPSARNLEHASWTIADRPLTDTESSAALSNHPRPTTPRFRVRLEPQTSQPATSTSAPKTRKQRATLDIEVSFSCCRARGSRYCLADASTVPTAASV